MTETTVCHCKIDPFDVYIGRGSKWGNPFSSKKGTTARFEVDSREEAIENYRQWIMTQPSLLQSIKDLKGKRLGCWCKVPTDPGRPCHGDILADLADNGIQLKRVPIEDLE